MAGSDPVYSYVMLKDKLLGFRPHLVIQCVNTSDLDDFLFRDGLERYKDGRTKFRSGPWWELPYRFSHVIRLLVHALFRYELTLVSESQMFELHSRAVKEYAELFGNNYNVLADSAGFQVLYIIQTITLMVITEEPDIG